MCLFYIFIYSYAGSEKLYAGSEKLYAGSEKLVRLLFFLRPSGSSPLFVCLLLRVLVRFEVLAVPQLQVILVTIQLTPTTPLPTCPTKPPPLDRRRPRSGPVRWGGGRRASYDSKAGSQETLAKALNSGGKPPGGRAIDGIMVSIMPACLCLCTLAKDGT